MCGDNIAGIGPFNFLREAGLEDEVVFFIRDATDSTSESTFACSAVLAPERTLIIVLTLSERDGPIKFHII
ncbi:MAG: hypothetical protein A3G18_01040 [Rhodospirillales bacterium RIFCSPLOWO2_12_FULL_58_28]|nr:MAG: hypothetical protein A3G18_01040 [Rhodospirillales bacterium RIFCSPLOWO2_12_FULL_58_28]